MRIDQDLPKMDQWVCHTYGHYVLDMERKVLSAVLPGLFGYNIAQIGGPAHDHYLHDSLIRHKIRLSPDVHSDFDGSNVVSSLYEMPFLPESLDVMVLPHVLEYTADPKAVLKSCYDSLVPEGHLIILGFNAWSLWGLAKLIRPNDRVYRRADFIASHNMRKLLQQQDFEIKVHKSMCYRPPIKNESWFHKVKFLEPLGRMIWPYLGAVYIMVARKRVAPMNFIGVNVKPKVQVRTRIVEPTV